MTVDTITKTFRVGTQDVQVLKGISFTVEKGDFMVIFGASGSGKSTLLHTLLGLEMPTSGNIHLLEKNMYDGLNDDDRSEFRKKHIGMVYQQPNWIKALKVIENVTFPLLLLGTDKNESFERGLKLLDSLGMVKWAHYYPTELSSGQQQKIALARALVTNPDVIIADEPTGNLDFTSGEELMQLLKDINQQGKTVIMVTHDLEYIRFAKDAIQIRDGQIIAKYADKEIAQLLKSIDSKRGDGDVPSEKNKKKEK